MRAHYFCYRALNRKGILTLPIEELPLHYNYSLCLIKEIILFFHINCLLFASSLKICRHLINKLIFQMSWGLQSWSHSLFSPLATSQLFSNFPKSLGQLNSMYKRGDSWFHKSNVPSLDTAHAGCFWGPLLLSLSSSGMQERTKWTNADWKQGYKLGFYFRAF